MADEVKVDLQDNSPCRVALALADRIANAEAGGGRKADRPYWLKLYFECRRVVVDGAKPQDG
jgi:hypothetical protein